MSALTPTAPVRRTRRGFRRGRRGDERAAVRTEPRLRRIAEEIESGAAGVSHRRREVVDLEGDVGRRPPADGVEQSVGGRSPLLPDDEVELRRGEFEEGDADGTLGRLPEPETDRVAVEGGRGVELRVE